jgi:hypothetical protein
MFTLGRVRPVLKFDVNTEGSSLLNNSSIQEDHMGKVRPFEFDFATLPFFVATKLLITAKF